MQQAMRSRLIGGLHYGYLQVALPLKVKLDVFPPSGGGLHCGYDQLIAHLIHVWEALAVNRRAPLHAPAVRRRAPLRHQVRHPARHRGDQVLPPFGGGLHCGGRMFPKLAPFRSGAPVLQRRAPLRHAVQQSPGCLPARVRLPFSGGPHRGEKMHVIIAANGAVLLPSDGGLHCGTFSVRPRSMGATCSRCFMRAPLRRSLAVQGFHADSHAPADQGGLHCGSAL